MGRRAIVAATLCGLGATLLMPATASAQQDRVSATEKGSLFIFSKVELRWDNQGRVLQDTFLSLTNDDNEDYLVQMYFINGDPELPADPITGERYHPGWNWVDNEITLTANQPIYWSAMTGMSRGGEVALSPFGQIESTVARKYQGTGLGLPLAKALAEIHGGSLTLTSEVDKGTVVEVRLPGSRLQPQTPARSDTASATKDAAA